MKWKYLAKEKDMKRENDIYGLRLRNGMLWWWWWWWRKLQVRPCYLFSFATSATKPFVFRLSESSITAYHYTVTVELENERNFIRTVTTSLLASLLHSISSATALLAFVAAETENN